MNRFYSDYLHLNWLVYFRIFYQFYEQIYSNISKQIILKKKPKNLMLKTNRAYSRSLRKHSILARNGTFLNKAPSPSPSSRSYSIPFLKFLYQNEVLHNFPKEGQHLIVKHNRSRICPKFDSKDVNKFSQLVLQTHTKYSEQNR